jgi:hypothetical protein
MGKTGWQTAISIDLSFETAILIAGIVSFD